MVTNKTVVKVTNNSKAYRPTVHLEDRLTDHLTRRRYSRVLNILVTLTKGNIGCLIKKHSCSKTKGRKTYV